MAPGGSRKSSLGQIPLSWIVRRGRNRFCRSEGSVSTLFAFLNALAVASEGRDMSGTKAGLAVAALQAYHGYGGSEKGGQQPYRAGDVQGCQDRCARKHERKKSAGAARDRQRGRHDGSQQGQEVGGGELLHAPPECVAVEEGRLAGDEDVQRADPARPDKGPEERVEGEREHCGERGQIGLK